MICFWSFSHQSLIDFFGPHGPSSVETQGLFKSTIFCEQDVKKKSDARRITLSNLSGIADILKKLDWVEISQPLDFAIKFKFG